MAHRTIRSLAELETLALDRLASGEAIGEARAMLAVEGDDIVGVEASPGVEAAQPVVAYLFDGTPARKRTIELLLIAYGASLLGPATAF